MHRHEDIATANELLVDIELRYRRPFGVFLDSYPSSVSWYPSKSIAIPTQSMSENPRAGIPIQRPTLQAFFQQNHYLK